MTNDQSLGASLSVLLAECAPDWLLDQLPPLAAALLREEGRIDPKLLAEVVSTLVNPKEFLARSDVRARLLGLLSEGKRRELQVRLGSNEVSGSWSGDLTQTGLNRLYEFFGLPDSPSPASIAPFLSMGPADYGLFPHQEDVLRRVAQKLSRSPRTVMLHLPTGTGKTRTAVRLIAQHLSATGPTAVVWLAASSELLDQASAEFERTWAHTGIRNIQIARFYGQRQGDITEVVDGVLFAGFQKLSALSEAGRSALVNLADRTTLVVVDEAHQLLTPTRLPIVLTLSQKNPRCGLLGLSATPGRTWQDIEKDGALAEVFNEAKETLNLPGYTNPVSGLIDEGYLARPVFKQLKFLDAGDDQPELSPMTDGEDYSGEVLERVGRSVARTRLVIQKTRMLASSHERIIVFAPSVSSAEAVAGLLLAEGIPARAVTGKSNRVTRQMDIKWFLGGAADTRVLVNYGVLTTGFDAPRASAALIARPTTSLVLYSQMVGRVLRGPRAGGGKECEIWTVVDTALPGFGDIADAFNNWEDVW